MLRIPQIIKSRIDLARGDPAVQSALRLVKFEANDGAQEIGYGLGLLCLSLALYANLLPVDPTSKHAIAIAMILCALLASRIHMVIRKRITWSRSGYVVPGPLMGSWWLHVLCVIMGFGLICGVCVWFLHLTGPITFNTVSPNEITPVQEAFCASFGMLGAISYLMIGGPSFKKHRWKWPLLVLMVLVPVGITLIVPGNFLNRFRPAALFVSLVMLGSGAATLYSYIRHTPRSSSEPE